MSLIENLSDVAATLIAQFGFSVTITRQAQGAYTPATATALPVGTAMVVFAIIEDVKGTELAAGLVEVGDRKFTIPGDGLAFTPTPGDLIYDGAEWRARSVRAPIVGTATPLFEIFAGRA